MVYAVCAQACTTCVYALEVVSRFPVPELHRAVVRSRHQYIVAVNRHSVDDGVVPSDVAHKFALGALPHLTSTNHKHTPTQTLT